MQTITGNFFGCLDFLLPKPLKSPEASLLQEQYQFLDPSTPPSSLAQQDQKLAQSKAFQQLLGVVRDGGQGVSKPTL